MKGSPTGGTAQPDGRLASSCSQTQAIAGAAPPAYVASRGCSRSFQPLPRTGGAVARAEFTAAALGGRRSGRAAAARAVPRQPLALARRGDARHQRDGEILL